MGKLYLVDIDNTLLDCLSGLEQVYPGYSKEQQLTYEFNIDGVSAKDVIANFFSKYFYQRVNLTPGVVDLLQGLDSTDKVIFVTYGDKDAKEFRVVELLKDVNFKCDIDLWVREYPSGGSQLDMLLSDLEVFQKTLVGHVYDEVVAVDDSPARLDSYRSVGVGYHLVQYPYNEHYGDSAISVIKVV